MFCFGSGRAIFNAKTDAEDKAPTFRPPDVKSQLIGRDPDAGKIVGKRRGIKRMRWWDSVTNLMDMSLRKLHKIVKDNEACFAVVHVITMYQTWVSNWTIPVRTQHPVKPLALVGVEKYLGGSGSFPSSGTSPWIQGKEHKILNVLPNIVF